MRLFLRVAVLALGIIVFHSSAAYAVCATPAGEAGDQIYNSQHNVMQYCNGTKWVAMGSVDGGGGPDADTLGALSCGNGQSIEYNGAAWACVAGKVSRSGDTMTGNLTVTAPSAAGHATTKQYVDDAIAAGISGLGGGVTLECVGGTNPQVHNGHCYTVFNATNRRAYSFSGSLPGWAGGSTLPRAQGLCQLWGGPSAGLVIINDAPEQAFITAQYATYQPWIGLTDGGSFGSSENAPRWWDGTAPTYTNWNGAPNQNASNNDVRLNADGTWRYEALTHRSYICEAPVAHSALTSQGSCATNELYNGEIFSSPPACDTMGPVYTCRAGVYAISGLASGGSCGGGGMCFAAGTRVAMADGSTQAIETLLPGDKVIGRHGVINTVVARKPTTIGDRKLYTINGTLKVTADHPAMTDKGWGVISRDLYADRYHGQVVDVTLANGVEAKWDLSLLPPEEMAEFGIGDRIAFGDGGFETITSLTSETLPSDTPLYTVALDGDGTFQLEGGFVFMGLSGKLATQQQALSGK